MRQHWNWKALIIGQKKTFKRKMGVKFKTPALARKIQLGKLGGVIWSLLRTRNLGYKWGLFYNDCYLELFCFIKPRLLTESVWCESLNQPPRLIWSEASKRGNWLPTAQIETSHPIPAAQSPWMENISTPCDDLYCIAKGKIQTMTKLIDS